MKNLFVIFVACCTLSFSIHSRAQEQVQPLWPEDEKIIFGMLSVAVLQMGDAANLLLDNYIDLDATAEEFQLLAEFLRKQQLIMGSKIRDAQILQRSGACELDASAKTLRKASRKYDKKTESVWGKHYSKALKSLSNSQALLLNDGIQNFKRSLMGYYDLRSLDNPASTIESMCLAAAARENSIAQGGIEQ